DFKLTETVAIGDSRNDISLFQEVGQAITLANANSHVKEHADVITTNAYGNGFLEAIEEIINGEN
ncbi:MAG: HAD hydrolase family protein, partial [Halobacteriaceae archaeon]